MLKYIFSIFLLFIFISSHGSPKVPANYKFAGMELAINEAARKQIQLDVDALHRNETYLRRKVEKIDLFFPIIERVFKEENLPDDFKYLTIQESALISDAVSSSNAVGFGQFKKASAIEVGLRVDGYVDERMHITASSRAAAKYIKKNNFFFNNWVYALLAYNTGPTGAKKHIDNKYIGKSKMDITKKTHWYVKKFLAYKIAFENEIHKNHSPALSLYEYENTQSKSLKEISDHFGIELQTISDYNKWLRKGNIPSDKTYFAIIPVSSQDLVAQKLLKLNDETFETEELKSDIVIQSSYESISNFDFKINKDYPIISKNKVSIKVKINGTPGFVASSSDDLNSVLSKFGLSSSKFLKYNDMTSIDKINEGQVYYLRAKKSKAKIHFHVVIPGENAWSISQKYGLKIKKLLTKNRMKEEKELNQGMVMWLRFIRPANIPVEYKKSNAQNMVIKSIPNEIQYSLPILRPENDGKSTGNLEIHNAKPNTELIETVYLFEELNDNTDFINENSYVDLNKETAKVNSDNVQTNLVVKTSYEKNNVKKEEFYHIVKSSETLFSISRAYGIHIEELRQWNRMSEQDILEIGQSILVKRPSNSNASATKTYAINQYKTHTVKQKDTLYSIARQYDISIKELMELNNKETFTIKEGEELRISAVN